MLNKALISIGFLLVILGPILFVIFPVTENVPHVSRYVIPSELVEMGTITKSPESAGLPVFGQEGFYWKTGNNFTICFMFLGCNNINVTFSSPSSLGKFKHSYNWTDVEGEWLNASFTLPTDGPLMWLYESDNVPYQRVWFAYISYIQHTSRPSSLNFIYFAFSIVGSLIIGLSMIETSRLRKKS